VKDRLFCEIKMLVGGYSMTLMFKTIAVLKIELCARSTAYCRVFDDFDVEDNSFVEDCIVCEIILLVVGYSMTSMFKKIAVLNIELCVRSTACCRVFNDFDVQDNGGAKHRIVCEINACCRVFNVFDVQDNSGAKADVLFHPVNTLKTVSPASDASCLNSISANSTSARLPVPSSQQLDGSVAAAGVAT